MPIESITIRKDGVETTHQGVKALQLLSAFAALAPTQQEKIMKYTHADLVKMRKAVVAEVVAEVCGPGADESYVNPATVEDRLRTYIAAGLTADDLEAAIARSANKC